MTLVPQQPERTAEPRSAPAAPTASTPLAAAPYIPTLLHASPRPDPSHGGEVNRQIATSVTCFSIVFKAVAWYNVRLSDAKVADGLRFLTNILLRHPLRGDSRCKAVGICGRRLWTLAGRGTALHSLAEPARIGPSNRTLDLRMKARADDALWSAARPDEVLSRGEVQPAVDRCQEA
jgi:hypothetical protein